MQLTPTAPPRIDLAAEEAAYRRAAQSSSGPVDAALRVAEGAVPSELRGVLVRNGPGAGDSFGVPYGHPFDGDGMLVRFAFQHDGVVTYRNRFVATLERAAEEQAKRPLFRSFGTNLPGGPLANWFRMRFKNAANTSVLHRPARGDRPEALFALWEGGWPHRLDPVSLDTLARDDLGGLLSWGPNTGSFRERLLGSIDRSLSAELPFSAHPKLCPATGDVLNFGVLLGRVQHLLRYTLPEDGEPRRLWSPLPRPSFVHDFAITERFEAFLLPPVVFDVPRALFGLLPPADALRLDPSKRGDFALFRRGEEQPAHVIETSPCFVFHFLGAFEDGERVIVDGCRFDDMPELRADRRAGDGPLLWPTPTRWELDLTRGTSHESRLTDLGMELATIDPRRRAKPYRFAYGIAAPPGTQARHFHAIGKLDVEARAPAAFRDFGLDLPGEPLFVPRPGGEAEDDGWVLTLVYSAEHHQSSLYVLRAADLSIACRLELPHHVPPGFHGTWIPAKA